MAQSRRLTELSARARSAVADLPGPLIVALSGGADSGVLAWAVHAEGIECEAVHVHHGWPGSDRMQEAAEAVADAVGVSLRVVNVDTDQPGSPEAVARIARYDALTEVSSSGPVLTGHTLDDQAETVLGNIVWGAGLDGLRGIDPGSAGTVRPFLGLSRTDVRELAVLLDLPFVDDPANDEARYRRVRIRRALHALESTIAPGVSARLGGLAAAVRSDVDELERLAAEVPVEQQDDAVRIPVGALLASRPALAQRAVRRALRQIHGGSPGTAQDVDDVLAVAAGAPAVEISGGFRVERRGAYVMIEHPAPSAAPSDMIPLTDGLRRDGWRWRLDRYAGRPSTYPLSRWRQVFADDSLANAAVRGARVSDRIAIGTGHKPVTEALAEAGVGSAERAGWPLLVVGEDPIWIPGARRAPLGWVTESTDGYVVVSAEREGRWTPVEY